MPTTSPVILGLLFEGSDPAAALLRDQEIVALAEEERFTRDKHAAHAFPVNAIRYCLNQAGVNIEGVDIVAVGWDAEKFPDHMDQAYAKIKETCAPLSTRALAWQDKNRMRYSPRALLDQLEEHLFTDLPPDRRPKVRFIPHHYAHAASAFLLSGFEDSCVVTADGHGEEDTVHIWNAGPDGISDLAQWNLPDSLGWFYTKFTQFFGFKAHDGEGKLMGLAAYGKPDSELASRVEKVLRLTGDDHVFEISPRFFFGQFADSAPYTPEWLDLFGAPLERDDPRLMEDHYRNLAFAVQKALEDVGKGLVRLALEKTGRTRVCVAGGSFMNCKMNGELMALVGNENFFAMPLAGDNGIAVGAALAAWLGLGLPWNTPLTHLYFGPEFSAQEIETTLREKGLQFQKPDDLPAATAALLAESKVVGWFQGRMEAGARALGNRSILGNPLDPKIRDTINAKVKFRELWRPFCPSTTEEDGPLYFDYRGTMHFMIVACEARPGMDRTIPSVVHCDNTVRVQSVSKQTNPRYHALITRFQELTGVGVVLNTSFNVQGEPIVCTPEDAVNCFVGSGIDVLAIGDYLVFKD